MNRSSKQTIAPSDLVLRRSSPLDALHAPACHAIILAAGASSRMGQEKARLPWLDGKMLLLWMVDELQSAGWLTTAVVRPESLEYWTALLPMGCVVANPDPERGKTTSLACGADALPVDTKWIIISSVDQPRPPALYRRLREEAMLPASKSIIVPGGHGRRGHPIVLAGAFKTSLLQLDEKSQGLRGLLDARPSEIHRLSENVSTEWTWDLNTPETYEQALTFFQEHLQIP